LLSVCASDLDKRQSGELVGKRTNESNRCLRQYLW
jgi:hypothetical protein